VNCFGVQGSTVYMAAAGAPDKYVDINGETVIYSSNASSHFLVWTLLGPTRRTSIIVAGRWLSTVRPCTSGVSEEESSADRASGVRRTVDELDSRRYNRSDIVSACAVRIEHDCGNLCQWTVSVNR